MRQKLFHLLVSAAVFALISLAVARAIAGFGPRAIEATRALVDVGADQVQEDIASRLEPMDAAVQRLTSMPELPTQVRQLLSYALVTQGERSVATRADKKQAELKEQIEASLAAFRADRPEIDAIVLVSETGIVISSGSKWLLPGRQLGSAEQGEANPSTSSPLDAMVRGALQGARVGAGVVLNQDTLYHVAVAPILQKGRAVGAALVERKLNSLPQPAGAEAFLVSGKKTVLGSAPAGFRADVAGSQREPGLLVSKSTPAHILGFALPVGPLFVDRTAVGVWGRRFDVVGAPQVAGFVVADMSPFFAELADLQAVVLVATLLGFLIHVVLILRGGGPTVRGVSKMADALGNIQRGVGDDRALNERHYPGSLHRLARLINQVLENGKGPARVPMPVKAPTVDDVLEAQQVPAPPDVGELEFEGITNSGSMGASATPSSNDTPFQNLGSFEPSPADSFVEQPAARALDGPPPEPAPLLGESAAAFSPAPPAAPTPPAGKSAGEAVVAMSPELMAELDALVGDTGDAPVSSFPARAEPAPDDANEVAFRRVFDEFVATREQCGEQGSLSYDKFRARLVQSREAVMVKHGCQDVQFQVYVKNGKAALKATPAR